MPDDHERTRRARLAVAVAALVGGITGLGVSLFDTVARDVVYHRLRHQPHALQVFAPVAALLLTAAVLMWVGKRSRASTADDYIAAFHGRGGDMSRRPVLARMMASVATLGLGGALGYEGPSIYFGAAVGRGVWRRWRRGLTKDDAKVMLVAGAAAGVAAIFKAPATGLVFALEVPYQDDFARRMLLPAAVASATSYLVFVTFHGTAPLFSVQGAPPFDLRDVGGALVLGVLCGIGARLFVRALAFAKQVSADVPAGVRAAIAGAGLAVLAAIAFGLTGEGLTLGAGYDTLRWSLDPSRGVALILAVLVLRGVATVLTVGGGGVGGLFIPLVIEGALLGRLVAGAFGAEGSSLTLFPLVGVAAFLGAGYRVPLAGVMFVAEATGRPGFVVPGLLAAVVAQLFMGDASASAYQVATRPITD